MPKLNIILTTTLTKSQLNRMKKKGIVLGDIPEFIFTSKLASGKGKTEKLKFEATQVYVQD